MKPSHITVTAGPGRLAPIHPDDGREPGGALMYVAPGMVRRVRLSATVERLVLDKDLIPCTMQGAALRADSLPEMFEQAAAPDEIEHGPAFVPVGADVHLGGKIPVAQPPPPMPAGPVTTVVGRKGGAS